MTGTYLPEPQGALDVPRRALASEPSPIVWRWRSFPGHGMGEALPRWGELGSAPTPEAERPFN